MSNNSSSCTVSQQKGDGKLNELSWCPSGTKGKSRQMLQWRFRTRISFTFCLELD